MSILKKIRKFFLPSDYDATMARVSHQRAYGVPLEKWADSNGRVEAIVCQCGYFRRDQPPGTYMCGCGTELYYSTRKLMCPACSELIIQGRSSWATYTACKQCRLPGH